LPAPWLARKAFRTYRLRLHGSFLLLFFRRKEAKESRLRKFAWFLQQKIERKPSRALAQAYACSVVSFRTKSPRGFFTAETGRQIS
jgi:hypothetical protein